MIATHNALLEIEEARIAEELNPDGC